MKVTKTVIDFLKKYKDGNVPDADVHALSDKLGIETSKLESVFYKLAAKYAQSVTEGKLNESGDYYEQLVDALSNSMEHMDKKEFVSFLSKETKYSPNQLAKVFDAYWKLGPEKFRWARLSDWAPFLSKFQITESKLNEEASVEALAISKYTATRPEYVDKFIADNNLNAKKLLALAVHGKLSDRLDIVTAMVGKPGNKYQKKLIAQLGESSSRRANDFFSDSKHGEALNNMFKGKFDPKKFDSYLDNMDKTTSSDVKYSRAINKLASDAGIDTKKYDNRPLADLEKALKAKTSELYTDYTSDKSTTKPVSSDAKIKNPTTGRNIKVSTALSYDKNSPAYKLAVKKVK